jgi:hypothetical protein
MRYGDDDAIVMRDAFEGRARPQPFGPPVAMLPGAGAPEFRPPVDFPPQRPGQPSPGQPAPLPPPGPVSSGPPMSRPPSMPPGVFGYAPGPSAWWNGGGPFLAPGGGGGMVATQPRQAPTLAAISTARPSSVSFWGTPWGGWGMPGPSSPQPGAFRTSPGQMSGFIRG